MIDVLYKSMSIPEECFLGKRIYKKFFYENVKLGVTDKKAFREDIDNIIWQYTLKPTTISIRSFKNDQREYLEIAVLQVNLKTMNRAKRIAEIVHRAIPYPVFLVFSKENNCALSIAHKRFSQAEADAIVAEDFQLTDWINLSEPAEIQKEFLRSMSLSEMPHTHYFALYSAMMARITALNCARFTSVYRIEEDTKYREEQKELLETCRVMEGQIATYKVAVKKEMQFNRKVELNMELKKAEKKLDDTIMSFCTDT